jgi:UDP-N-acetyl-D-mannosaminuronic acid dehydrogenase
MNEFQSLCVVGLGYIGLPTAALFAQRGLAVYGVDVNPSVIKSVRNGNSHIIEPGLDEVLREVVATGALAAGERPVAADAFLIAVPTPFAENHIPDLSFVNAAVESVATVVKRGDLVVLESTSPVGTTDGLSTLFERLRPDLRWPHRHGSAADVNIAYCPERVLPGSALKELIQNDRVIGGLSPECGIAAASLYKRLVQAECLVTTARTAELCKLAENSFRDVNIAFANELSILCKDFKVDVWELIKLANRHPRVDILSPGCGVGGHCIAVDPWFIVSAQPANAELIHAARRVNDRKPQWVISETMREVAAVADEANRHPQSIRIGCLGLSFKADIDDLRESPALEIARQLAVLHAGEVIAADPFVSLLPKSLRTAGVVLKSVDELLLDADVILLLVGHSAFRPFFESGLIAGKVIDACGAASRWKR